MRRSARPRAMLGIPLTRGSVAFFTTAVLLLLLVSLALATLLQRAA